MVSKYGGTLCAVAAKDLFNDKEMYLPPKPIVPFAMKLYTQPYNETIHKHVFKACF